MRRLAAVAALVALAMLAGCGGGGIDRAALSENATYDWNTTANATYDVSDDGEFTAVLNLQNRSSVAAYQYDRFGDETPMQLSAVKFRYRNGTVVDAAALTVETDSGRTVVQAPRSNGTLAFTASHGSKRFVVPTAVSGSHVVSLPSGMRVSVPLFGHVRPGGYETTLSDDRVRIRWDDVEAGTTIDVQYYLGRDVYIFLGLVSVLFGIAVAGVIRFRLQIRRLEREREAAEQRAEE